MQKLFKSKTDDKSGPIPGAMGRVLAVIGIDEIGPHLRSGTPMSVLTGCRKGVMVVPNTDHPAMTRAGKPLICQRKGSGQKYQAMDQHGMDRRDWKRRVNDEKRKATGRWYSGEPQSSIDARRAKAA